MKFEFHGVRVELRCSNPELRENLRRDFSWFHNTWEGAPDIELEVRPTEAPAGKQPVRSPLRWRKARIAQSSGIRRIDYGEAYLEYDLKKERGVLYGENKELLHELGFLTIMSRVGEVLDRRGLHRVHALGFTYKGSAGLLVLPSNGGKSRLGLEILRSEGFGFLADDIPLLAADGREARGFPLRLGLRDRDRDEVPAEQRRVFPRRRFGIKHLVDIDAFDKAPTRRADLRWIIIGDRDGRLRPMIQACSKLRAAAGLLAPLVLGVGSPQVLELQRPLRLARIGLKRSAAAVRATRSAQTATFKLGAYPSANVAALRRFLENA